MGGDVGGCGPGESRLGSGKRESEVTAGRRVVSQVRRNGL